MVEQFFSNLRYCFKKTERNSSTIFDIDRFNSAICFWIQILHRQFSQELLCFRRQTSADAEFPEKDSKIQGFLRALFLCFVAKLKHHQSGYVLIMVACFIPVILLGIQYSQKLFEYRDKQIRTVRIGDDEQKNCAPEAALAVAKNWNPGLTLGQQREGVYKVADAVYNINPTRASGLLIARAIPGIVLHQDGGTASIDADRAKKVKYTNSTLYNPWFEVGNSTNDEILWNPSYAVWLTTDKGSDSSKRISNFDEIDATELTKGNFVLNQHEIDAKIHPGYTFGQCTIVSNKCGLFN